MTDGKSNVASVSIIMTDDGSSVSENVSISGNVTDAKADVLSVETIAADDGLSPI